MKFVSQHYIYNTVRSFWREIKSQHWQLILILTWLWFWTGLLKNPELSDLIQYHQSSEQQTYKIFNWPLITFLYSSSKNVIVWITTNSLKKNISYCSLIFLLISWLLCYYFSCSRLYLKCLLYLCRFIEKIQAAYGWTIKHL